MSEFSEKLILLIIQYLIIGSIVALAGHYLSRALERFKSTQALKSEVAKQRIAALAECWRAINKWEVTLQKFRVRAAEIRTRPKDSSLSISPKELESLKEIESRSREQHNTVIETITGNRFWLGDEIYKELNRYTNEQFALMTHFLDSNMEEFGKLEIELEKQTAASLKRIQTFLDDN